MNVSGIRPREEIYAYNSIRRNVLRNQQMFEAKKRSDANTVQRDVAKAISDMGKDFVLQQYQYFVGSSEATTDTRVFRTGENFAL